MLSDYEFSDLLIMEDGSGQMKGCPGSKPGDEQRLIPIPEDCEQEVREMMEKLPSAFMNKSRLIETPDQDVARIAPQTIRFEHNGISYRVADVENADLKKVWFLRRLPKTVPSLEDLGMPAYMANWLQSPEQRQGLILICGAQASGKTTTAGALIKDRLTKFGGHAVTLENPADLPLGGPWGEYGHCFQTEILSETELAARIEMAHRYASPNIIFIGEIKTRYAAQEVLRVALGSSQQMVIATLHGLNVIAALDRLINWAMEEEGENARQNLADSLLGIIFQDLRHEEGRRLLRIPEFLLVPFVEESKGIRAQLREGNYLTLENDMREQRNKLGMRNSLTL